MAGEKSLRELKNIGPAMEAWLLQARITSPKKLIEMGAVEAYLRIRTLHPNAANKMALYALYGAIHDINCLKIPSDVKAMLNAMVDDALIRRDV